MSPSTDRSAELLDLWYRAEKLEVGLAVKTDDRKLLRQQLYRARDAHDDDLLRELVILAPDIDGELWIVHRNADETG